MEKEKKDVTEGKRDARTFPWIMILLISLIVIETAILVYAAIQRNTEVMQLSSTRQKMASIKKENDKIKQQLNLVQSEKSNLEIKVMDINQEKLKLQLQQKELEKSKDRLEESRDELEQSRTKLERKLKREKQISIYLRRKWEASVNNEFVLMKKVKELVNSKKKLQDQMKFAEQEERGRAIELEGVPLKEVVVTEATDTTETTDTDEANHPLTGAILIANHEVEPPFVIIDLGTTDGVSIGDRFAVIKGKKKRVGSITVSKLYPQMAVADIDKKNTRRKLKTNWKVVSE